MSYPLRVLVVDDELTIIQSTGDYLRVRGFEVTTARELEEAEALVAVDEFDVVVTDVRLTPGGREEGLDLTSFVSGRSPRTAVIVMTGFASEETQRTARERGACLVLQKPVPLSIIEQSVVSITKHCAANGAECSTLCEPLRLAAGGNTAASTDVAHLGALLAAISPDRNDEENAATIASMLHAIDRLEAGGNRQLAGLVGSCFSGSSVLTAISRATAAQHDAGQLAIRLHERFEALKFTR